MKPRVCISTTLLIGFLLLITIPQLSLGDRSNAYYEAKRREMVATQIDARSVKDGRIGVKDKQVLEAMSRTLRHEFVPTHLKSRAYFDSPLPIGYDQTISQPYIVAYMTESLKLKKEHKVLEVGTGSGYQAAVLAKLVDHVYTIEIIKELSQSAKKRMKDLGYENVTVKSGDGYYGWEKHAPYDAIIVTAAPDHIPPPLVQQLKPRGVMCIPVGRQFQTQNLTLVQKTEGGSVKTKQVMWVSFVPLTRKKKQ
jgi:protein-L-isoaspartate(D-aspartate) O-methyltransferase